MKKQMSESQPFKRNMMYHLRMSSQKKKKTCPIFPRIMTINKDNPLKIDNQHRIDNQALINNNKKTMKKELMSQRKMMTLS